MRVKMKKSKKQDKYPCEICKFSQKLNSVDGQDTADYFCPFGTRSCLMGNVRVIKNESA